MECKTQPEIPSWIHRGGNHRIQGRHSECATGHDTCLQHNPGPIPVQRHTRPQGLRQMVLLGQCPVQDPATQQLQAKHPRAESGIHDPRRAQHWCRYDLQLQKSSEETYSRRLHIALLLQSEDCHKSGNPEIQFRHWPRPPYCKRIR